MAARPGRKIARVEARGPHRAGRAVGNVVALHEAIVLCMVREGEFTMALKELVKLNFKHKLYLRPTDGKFPEAVQMRARTVMREYRQFFKVAGKGEEATVSLRRFGTAPGFKL